MAKQLKLRRGTTSQHGSFTGAEGEVTVDTDKETLVVHDGSTAGGHPVAAEDMANVSSANILSRISTGAIVGTKLENSGVTAGSYGSSSAIPIVTVDAQGLVTAASTTAIDSTTISNGSASVAVANNGPITSNANHDFSAGIDVTGNISVTGTVDGVDIAAFKTAFDEAFPSGTKMLFQQTSAPTGWTKVTSGVDNKSLRVVSGTAGSGGTNAFTNTFTNKAITANSGDTTATGNISLSQTSAGGNVSIDSASTGGTVNSHTLSTNEMPSHRHQLNKFIQTSNNQQNSNVPGFTNANNIGWSNYQGYRSYNQFWGYTDYHGGSGGHSHGFTGGSHNHNGSLSGTAHNHNATFTGSAHNHSISVNNLDMAVQYLDVIIASKD